MSLSHGFTAFIFAWLAFVAGCASAKRNAGTVGIGGQVRWYEGNLMPMAGDTTYARRARGVPVQRELYIYKAVKRDEAVQEGGSAKFYTKIKAPLVKKVKTAKDGTFRVALPPGRYSVLVMENGRFYAAFFDGQGYLAPVTVQPGVFTEVLLKINYRAVY